MTPNALSLIVGLLPVFLFGMLVAHLLFAPRLNPWPYRSPSVCGGEIVVFEDGTVLLLRAGEVRVLNAPVAPPVTYDDGGI
ncbi:MAG: hypothetical protein ABL908_20070 [Hyphomicrobium sp.]